MISLQCKKVRNSRLKRAGYFMIINLFPPSFSSPSSQNLERTFRVLIIRGKVNVTVQTKVLQGIPFNNSARCG